MIDLRFATVKEPLPDFIYADIAPYVAASNTYHHQAEELLALLLEKHSLPSEFFRITSGNDASILKIIARYGQQTHAFTPTYIGYTDAKIIHGALHAHDAFVDNQYTIETARIPDASLIFLANPNNPFGTTSREAIVELVANNPHAIVVIDEAYGDFADLSVIDKTTEFKNLIVLRSFSKGYALAGFRCGYMVADPALLEQLELETTWFGVSYPAMGAAVSALNHESYFADIRAGIVKRREALEAFLRERGYAVMSSMINAVTVQFADATAAANFHEFLATHDILVGQGNGASNVGLDDTFVRLAVGTAEQMEEVTRVLHGF